MNESDRWWMFYSKLFHDLLIVTGGLDAITASKTASQIADIALKEFKSKWPRIKVEPTPMPPGPELK